MILPASTTIDLTWAVWRANRPSTFKVPRPKTKTTQKGMRLKPRSVPERGKKTARFNVVQTWGLLTAPLSEFANACSWFIWVHSTCPFLTSITIIYIRKCFSQRIIKEVCLGAMTIYHELEFLWTLWFARGHHKWLGLSLGRVHDKQVGHVQSTRAKGKIAETQLKLEFGKA